MEHPWARIIRKGPGAYETVRTLAGDHVPALPAQSRARTRTEYVWPGVRPAMLIARLLVLVRRNFQGAALSR